MTTIDNLPPDVLREIFLYIDFSERQRLSLVCKKWQNINHIILRSIRKIVLRFTMLFLDITIVKQYGDIITFMAFGPDEFGIALERLSDHLEGIEILDKDTLGANYSINFWKSIALCKKLTYARFLCDTSSRMAEFLKYLPTDNLEHLSIVSAGAVQEKFDLELQDRINEVLTKATKLISVDMFNMPIRQIRAIKGLQNLKSLYITIKKPFSFRFDNMELPNLETIVVKGNIVQDIIIAELYKCRKLRTVSLITSNLYSKNILNLILALPKLRHLQLLPYEDQKYSPINFEEMLDLSQRPKKLKTYDLPEREKLLFSQAVHNMGFRCVPIKDLRYFEWITHYAMLRNNKNFSITEYKVHIPRSGLDLFSLRF
ncbi:hypothetical protein PV327_008962 [Microctonus hyperodae]|uniref:F-box domain-containing protein n=1 Tax=Microctonus hyperodae TaxID=165561 RepID=A0AA39FST2_MICHY|nr:hypothetical protein PV327_008962 [Microctonus hyperodae]